MVDAVEFSGESWLDFGFDVSPRSSSLIDVPVHLLRLSSCTHSSGDVDFAYMLSRAKLRRVRRRRDDVFLVR